MAKIRIRPSVNSFPKNRSSFPHICNVGDFIFGNGMEERDTLTFVASNTEKIALGTSVIDMLFHNPVISARRFAKLDVLSEERAICMHLQCHVDLDRLFYYCRMLSRHLRI